jgi:hypothetical protein
VSLPLVSAAKGAARSAARVRTVMAFMGIPFELAP